MKKLFAIILMFIALECSSQVKIGYLICYKQQDGYTKCVKVKTTEEVNRIVNNYLTFDYDSELNANKYFHREIYIEKKRINKRGKYKKLRKKDLV